MARPTPNQPASDETIDPSLRGYGPDDTLWCLYFSSEGFECDLGDVAEHQRALLREAFHQFEHADELLDDGRHPYAWWDRQPGPTIPSPWGS